MNYDNPLLRRLRESARKLGILKVLKRWLPRDGAYEDKFGVQLRQAIRPGDVVWDIGANVGFYTTKFSEWIGAGGTVVAFEPLTAARTTLARMVAESVHKNIVVCDVALADRNELASFAFTPGENGISTTGHLAEAQGSATSVENVEVVTASNAVAKFNLPLPNVTKIDVEGFEIEVVKGGAGVFDNLSSRHLFIEVHFERLAERGKSESLSEMIGQLKSYGYSIRWIDPSHLHAVRDNA
jgi:FkbM family methyltransferase